MIDFSPVTLIISEVMFTKCYDQMRNNGMTLDLQMEIEDNLAKVDTINVNNLICLYIIYDTI